MRTMFGKTVRILLAVFAVLVVAALIGGAWFYSAMRASLPVLDGQQKLNGLAGPVAVSRDALGIPSVSGQSRTDVVRALGFLHAQDRFFQMDLLRRRSAGELAALFGKAALPIDRSTRVHGFRALARQVLSRLPDEQRQILSSYTAGVNGGLAALHKKPFEYIVLRAEPMPWKEEDTLLVVYSMILDLQDSTGSYELSLTALRDQLGFAGVAFFAPLYASDDAALDGTVGVGAAIPGADILDLRRPQSAALARLTPMYATTERPDPDALPGSNNFALSGSHTANGAALLANDPHLDLNIPNIWYRASLTWKEPRAVNVSGVTLPGLPTVVIGSNGHIAWGLTDAYADTGDLIVLDVNTIDPRLYKVPGQEGFLEIERRKETIEVKGGEAVTIEVPWTRWGPIVAQGTDHRPLVYHWLAHDPAATDFSFMNLLEARDVAQAVEIAHHVGIPAHNFVVIDTTGSIGWTVIGRLPIRVGYDGRLPTSWRFGDRRWDGMLTPAETPTIVNPPDGRIWTANNRVVGGSSLSALGDGGYAAPARAKQIRDGLARLEKASPQDLRAIQLDDRALFLAAWQQRVLAVLTPDAVAQKKSRAKFRELVEHWEGHASVDSVSYRLVRAFRSRTADLVFNPIFARCVEEYPGFDWRKFHYEGPLQALLRDQPMHLLDPKYPNWRALELAAVDAVVADFDEQGINLPRATWGRRNTARIDHPLGRILPKWLGGWLNMPADQLPGDVDMPRVQTPTFGASMRVVVSPGHEAEGLLHMSGGQSGNPLSPYYRAGHEAWVKGEPTPFLPGPPEHQLELVGE